MMFLFGMCVGTLLGIFVTCILVQAGEQAREDRRHWRE